MRIAVSWNVRNDVSNHQQHACFIPANEKKTSKAPYYWYFTEITDVYTSQWGK